jgi:hypothetical protein
MSPVEETEKIILTLFFGPRKKKKAGRLFGGLDES